MYLLDIILLVPLLLIAVRGFMTGLVKQILGIAGLFLAIYITFNYMSSVSNLFTTWIESRDTAVLLAAIFLFVATMIIVNLLASWIDSLVSFIQLNFINRTAGFLFGAFYASVILSVAMLLLSGFDIPNEEMREQSVIYPIILPVAPAMYDAFASLWPEARSFIETIEQAIMDNNTLRNLPLFEKTEP